MRSSYFVPSVKGMNINMRKINNIFIILLLIICSTLFVSCKAITAQNISHNSSEQGMNGNQRMDDGGQGAKGNSGRNDGQGKDGGVPDMNVKPGMNGEPGGNGGPPMR